MRKEPRHLKQLEKELLALGEETMLLEELDGFIAGVLDDQTAPIFDTVAHMNKMLTLVMEHYNDVAKKLFEMPERYAPLFAIDNRNGDVLWELWIEGFEKAVKLRPAAWRPLLDADVETAKAMSGLLTLADVARRDERFSELEYHALEATAHERMRGLRGRWGSNAFHAASDSQNKLLAMPSASSDSNHGINLGSELINPFALRMRC
jgi:uncharacterized protein